MSHRTDPIILPLPAATTSLLRSNLVIPSLPSIFVELLQNSIDADSTTIALFVDLNRWTIKCADDGRGIEWDRAAATMAVGERYWSSKAATEGMNRVETFGFRGEALASMADIALLEVLTRPRRTQKEDAEAEAEGESYSLIVRGGTKLAEGRAKRKRSSTGTTVWVREIFYKYPVRRRPLSTPAAQVTLINAFRLAIATISLVHPSIAFSLHDLASTNDSPAKLLISVSKTREGALGRWRQLWGRAGVERVAQVMEWESEKKEFGMTGFFSLTASHSKSSQFVYINARPLSSASKLQKLINDLFARSAFSRHASSLLVAPASKSPVRKETQKLGPSVKSPKKVAERYPVFLLNLKAPPGMIDVTLEPEKRVIEFEDEDRVHAFVRRVVAKFLKDQGFIPAAEPTCIVSDTLSSASLSALPLLRSLTNCIVEPPPPHQHRQDEACLCSSAVVDSSNLAAVSIPQRVIEREKELRVFPGDDEKAYGSNGEDDKEPQVIEWVNPITMQTFLVDSRTGNSWRPPIPHSLGSSISRTVEQQRSDILKRGRTSLVDKASLRKRLREEGHESSGREVGIPSWMSNTISEWNNPVFPVANSLQITSLFPLSTTNVVEPDNQPFLFSSRHLRQSNMNQPLEVRFSDRTWNSNGPRPRDHHYQQEHQHQHQHHFQQPLQAAARGQKFTRDGLKESEFVAQVDRKFLLIRMSSTPPSSSSTEINTYPKTLVMIDQHAASERIRVEAFLSSICGAVAQNQPIEVYTLAETDRISVVLSREESSETMEWRAEFERWGIRIAFDEMEMETEGRTGSVSNEGNGGDIDR